MEKIVVNEKAINITGASENDYVSLTDIAKFKADGDANAVVSSWMRRIDTIGSSRFGKS